MEFIRDPFGDDELGDPEDWEAGSAEVDSWFADPPPTLGSSTPGAAAESQPPSHGASAAWDVINVHGDVDAAVLTSQDGAQPVDDSDARWLADNRRRWGLQPEASALEVSGDQATGASDPDQDAVREAYRELPDTPRVVLSALVGQHDGDDDAAVRRVACWLGALDSHVRDVLERAAKRLFSSREVPDVVATLRRTVRPDVIQLESLRISPATRQARYDKLSPEGKGWLARLLDTNTTAQSFGAVVTAVLDQHRDVARNIANCTRNIALSLATLFPEQNTPMERVTALRAAVLRNELTVVVTARDQPDPASSYRAPRYDDVQLLYRGLPESDRKIFRDFAARVRTAATGTSVQCTPDLVRISEQLFAAFKNGTMPWRDLCDFVRAHARDFDTNPADGPGRATTHTVRSTSKTQRRVATVSGPVTGDAVPNVPGHAVPNVPGHAVPNVPGHAVPNVPGLAMPELEEPTRTSISTQIFDQEYPDSQNLRASYKRLGLTSRMLLWAVYVTNEGSDQAVSRVAAWLDVLRSDVETSLTNICKQLVPGTAFQRDWHEVCDAIAGGSIGTDLASWQRSMPNARFERLPANAKRNLRELLWKVPGALSFVDACEEVAKAQNQLPRVIRRNCGYSLAVLCPELSTADQRLSRVRADPAMTGDSGLEDGPEVARGELQVGGVVSEPAVGDGPGSAQSVVRPSTGIPVPMRPQSSTAVVGATSSYELLFGDKGTSTRHRPVRTGPAQVPIKTVELNRRYRDMVKRDRDDIKRWVRHAAGKRVEPSYADLPPAVPKDTAKRLLAQLFPAIKSEAKREYEFARAIKHKWLTPH